VSTWESHPRVPPWIGSLLMVHTAPRANRGGAGRARLHGVGAAIDRRGLGGWDLSIDIDRLTAGDPCPARGSGRQLPFEQAERRVHRRGRVPLRIISPVDQHPEPDADHGVDEHPHLWFPLVAPDSLGDRRLQ
jgi:hypothetical protein